MDKSCFVQQTERIEELLGKDSNESGAQATELILLNELVQVDAEQLEDKAEVLLMDEGVFKAQDVVVVILVEFAVELYIESHPNDRA